MVSIRRLATLLATVLAGLLAAAPAQAQLDPLGFRFSSPAYVAHESDGFAEITITRINVAQEAQIRYMTLSGTAKPGADFRPVKDMIDFQPGQANATFRIAIVDHHIPDLPRTLNLGLFGASPIGLGEPHNAVLTILNDDPAPLLRDPTNPLGLPATPANGNPLLGAKPYVDWKYGLAASQERQYRHSHPDWARAFDVIAREPETHRFGNWVPNNQIAIQVSQYLERASIEQPGTVPMMSTYWLPWHHCGGAADPPWRVGLYHQWIQNLARGVGAYRGILFLEMDSLITVGCLSRHGLAVRMQELHDAIDTLSKVPHLVVYLDAGAADAKPAGVIARLLKRAGVSEIQGFFLNSTHFDWTSREIKYGRRISRMTGGKHFVVNTAVNGRGPLVPWSRVRYGNEVLCNPPGRGLGPLPTFNTGFRNVDAFAWIGNPGKSGGTCVPGAPPTGTFWPQLALELVKNADFRVR
ncbi:MAG: glycoside hydrolase family 6 protein [Solirubrobacteraceae bacterium]|jgi:endoglucanase